MRKEEDRGVTVVAFCARVASDLIGKLSCPLLDCMQILAYYVRMRTLCIALLALSRAAS